MADLPAPKARLGELLVARGHITPVQLEHSLEVQAEYPRLRIGEIMVKLRYLTMTILQAILAERQDSMRLGEILLLHDVITQEQLFEALEFQGTQGHASARRCCSSAIARRIRSPRPCKSSGLRPRRESRVPRMPGRGGTASRA